uniref:nSTAND1 domain-containing NTPase n=1 Tax=Roseibium sediminis TaxID=1775174 RepID=UPI00186522CC
MSGVWQANIVRLLSCIPEADGRRNICGTGTLVLTEQDELCVLTCAHVLNDCRGKRQYFPERPDENEVFFFDLPAVNSETVYQAVVLEWSKPAIDADRVNHKTADIALLRCAKGIKTPVKPYGPDDFKSAKEQNPTVHTFGFATDAGISGSGQLAGQDAAGWSILKDAGTITSGFSGAAVFDANRSKIIGMVVSIRERVGTKDVDLTFVQSVEHIHKACPQLARPYRGLNDYDEEHAAYFHGRKEFAQLLRSKLEKHVICGVSAASGAGKSSAVKAGLFPILRQERNWLILQMRPGADPWFSLATALQPLTDPGGNVSEVLDKRRTLASLFKSKSGPSDLQTLFTMLANQHSGIQHILIVVDQFEELFTISNHTFTTEAEEEACEPDAIKRAPPADFRDFMIATARLADLPSLQWLYTLRADFGGPAYKHPGFVDALGDGEVKLANMRPEDLRDAIVKPAKHLGVEFESGNPPLSERIADAVETTPDSLPLLSHLMEAMWRRLRHRTLHHHDYDELGGLEGALNQHAEQVYRKFAEKGDGDAVRRLMCRLVVLKLDETNEPTKRTRSRQELGEELWDVASFLAENRLLIIRRQNAPTNRFDAEEENDLEAQTVEVIHEALLRGWARLRNEWIADDLRFLKWQHWLEGKIRDYRDSQNTADLLQSNRLSEAINRLEERKDDLSEEEINYIQLSASEDQKRREDELALSREREKTERALREEAQRQAGEARKQSRKSDRWTKIASVVAISAIILFLAAVYFGVSSFSNQKLAEDRTTQSETNKSIFAVALADQLVQQNKIVTAIQVLKSALPSNWNKKLLDLRAHAYHSFLYLNSKLPHLHTTFEGHKDWVWSAVFSKDETFVLTASDDTTAKLWSVETGNLVKSFEG